jgi:hypothetical protein
MDILIFVACIVVIAIVVLVEVKLKGIRVYIIDIILEAEKQFASGEGLEKMEFVVGIVREFLPLFIRPFITTSLLKSIVQKVFNEIKEVLDYVPNPCPETVFSDTVYEEVVSDEL